MKRPHHWPWERRHANALLALILRGSSKATLLRALGKIDALLRRARANEWKTPALEEVRGDLVWTLNNAWT